jgi:hypothetical protein
MLEAVREIRNGLLLQQAAQEPCGRSRRICLPLQAGGPQPAVAGGDGQGGALKDAERQAKARAQARGQDAVEVVVFLTCAVLPGVRELPPQHLKREGARNGGGRRMEW